MRIAVKVILVGVVGLWGGRYAAGGLPPKNPDNPTEWFRHADDLTNIRMPDSAPFHMTVNFHAYPGMDFAKPGKSDINTGDGTYEEWWESPEKWRREVSLTGYHAVEVRADGVRKMQASSDYEPSRVLMLLDALLSPVSRNLLEPRLSRNPPDWTVKHLSVGGLRYVRLDSQFVLENGKTYFEGYNFLPSGILIRKDDFTSMMTSWQGFTLFAGRVVPGQITVQAMGRDLLSATIHIESLPASKAIDQIPGPAALPGSTLRPLHSEVKVGNPYNGGWGMVGNLERFAFRRIIDQSGKSREVELIATNDVNSAKAVLPHLRVERSPPPTIDGSPCEIEDLMIY